MQEIVKINLDNEMDLILAHKRSMKIAELCGLPSSAQTRFATAVSEIARCSITQGKDSVLTLGINIKKATLKEITAILTDSIDLKKCNPDAYTYAAKISGNIDYEFKKQSLTTLAHVIPSPGFISDLKIKGFKDYFRHEPPLSPYDEIRKKNLELIALSEKLGESEARYRQLSETLPVLICIVDDHNRILLTNNWLKNYLIKTLEIFDSHTITTFVHENDSETLIRGWENAKRSNSGFVGQVRIKTGNDYEWHLVSIVPNRQDESIKNWLVYFVDINAQKLVDETLKDNTTLKRIQHQLEQTNTQLSFKNRELEQFAFVASHDLQEPLRKIMIMISRAVEHVDEQQRKALYLDKIGTAAERMSKLINDVLDYSRVNNSSENFLTINLNDVILQVLDELSFVIAEKDAVIHIADLPEITGVETQLNQLFHNLLSNSLKFSSTTPDVTIAIEMNIPFPDHSGDEMRYNVISIKDNGIGIPEGYSQKIFGMFQRLHHKDSYTGNGIGLALCKRIMVNHGGEITYESVEGQGTTFHLYFPIKKQ